MNNHRPIDAPPIPDNLIRGLNQEQQAAVLHGRGPALVLAGAGSGKTRVLTHRIAGLISVGVSASNILALTFTNKAAREMKERVRLALTHSNIQTQGEVTLQTFHAFGASFLRRHAELCERSEQFVIYDRDDQIKLIKEVLKQQKVDLEREALLDLCTAFDTAKQLGEEAHYAYCPPLDSRPGVDVKRLGWAYEEALKRSDAFDFGDLIVKPLKLLEADQELKARYRQRFTWVLVDEFQDTNKAQMLLLKSLCPIDADLFVVGDDDQSIYAWRGAEVSNILGFDQHFPSAKTYKLQQNYRSQGNILNAANGVIRFNSSRLGKRLWTEQAEGNKITLYVASNDYDEADFVARQIKNLVKSQRYKYSDIAILYRANALSLTLENTFVSADYTIPYVIVRGRHFFERAEIKDALAYIRLLINPFDVIAYQRAISTETRGVGKTSLAKVVQMSSELNIHLFAAAEEACRMGVIRGKAQAGLKNFYKLYTEGSYLDHEGLADQAKALLIQAGLYQPQHLEDMVDESRRARAENLARLIDMIQDFDERSSQPSWFAFLEQVKLVSDDEDKNAEQTQSQASQGAVSLMTVHASKGLEFPVVFLVGLEENIFPNARRGGSSELEEERRLFYVAVTRAEQMLVLSYAERRTIHGRNQPQVMSQFISEIDEKLLRTVKPQHALHAWANRSRSVTQADERSVQRQARQEHRSQDLGKKEKYRENKELAGKPKPLSMKTPQPKQFHQTGISVGSQVEHKTYGVGEILSIERKSRGDAARVRFKQSDKVILLSFLTLVDSE